MSSPGGARGFSLIEVLVVVVVVGILMGFALSPKGDEKDVQVKAAAYELAGVLRQARTAAMESKAMYAVAFNLQNTPGTSGRQLANGSGGHWYRILGPRNELTTNGANVGSGGYWSAAQAEAGVGAPPIYDKQVNELKGGQQSYNTLNQTAALPPHFSFVEKSWIGDRRTLNPGKVRFVALTDMDNGGYMESFNRFPATYPRPWFGWWDAATKRLYPWGGYDPALAMTTQPNRAANGIDQGPNAYWFYNCAKTHLGRTLSHSGFFYEGYDGIITGCRQPSDRLIMDDKNGDGWLDTADFASPVQFPLWRQGDPRPLINGDWQDFMIVFRPDGTAWTSWMALRHSCSNGVSSSSNIMFYDPSLMAAPVTWGAPADPTKRNFLELGPGDMAAKNSAYEATSYPRRSGFNYITLGPDLAQPDLDTYSSAAAALRSLLPLYRVGVSPYGEVVVVKVGTTKPPGKTYDTAITGGGWNAQATTDAHWSNYMLVNNDATRSWRGTPISDIVTPDMLADRKWWWQ